ncbi:Sensor kinase protein RcsC [Oligella ureolytica]|uniref:hybrid sensor histidine kinase/response regulator n=1 Tax=Oligella ureolytica TaxID=90244 RepID=UPI000E03717C|nr:PAS domain-containing hybrid sensor histidine kinase/response regulator [Oligella ureolytica]SUA56964.1 Sensor kinase protein RcsC [Oligella ureolytica]
MSPTWVILASFIYLAILFGIAWAGDRYPLYEKRAWLRPTVYSLALAVYCSSWTFYGAVGSAVRHGWGYLPIYLGPFLMMVFFWRFLERLALAAQTQKIVSISDFMASRYERSQRLAGLVTIVALVAVVPYLALQFKAVTMSIGVFIGHEISSIIFGDPALYVAALMALFVIVFGTRQADATEHRPGLMLAIAAESLIKLVALIAVGIFAFIWLTVDDLDAVGAIHTLTQHTSSMSFVGQTLLAFAAVICLPRQFHVAIVESGDVRDIRSARWIFSLYLVLIALMVLPITMVAFNVFEDSSAATTAVMVDSYVLLLPLYKAQKALALLVYIGGFSAATGMMIVTSVALSTMVSNDLIMPYLLRRGWAEGSRGDYSKTLLWVRRGAVFFLVMAAYGYYAGTGSETALSAYGLMAFAAVVQFAPGLIGGLSWLGASRRGVEVGLAIGSLVWAYTLLLPALADAGWFSDAWVERGPFGIEWLIPYRLFGFGSMDPLTHGTFWSLIFNTSFFLLISLLKGPSLAERLRARTFLDPYAKNRRLETMNVPGNLLVHDLLVISGRIVGEARAMWSFEIHAKERGLVLSKDLKADAEWVQFTELMLAAVVGAASARLVLGSALRGSGVEVDVIVSVLDETRQELSFNRDVLTSTLENLEQGISVVDADMNLVAWNQKYKEFLDLPPSLLKLGQPVSDIMYFNAMRGRLRLVDSGNVTESVERRLNYMLEGSSYSAQRLIQDNQVIEIRGRPLPGGGYVTSYTDVTDFKRVEKELLEINMNLEQRVAERTEAAEKAQRLRSYFLTAVSHDVLQPINAARLFATSLQDVDDDAEQMRHLAERVDTSLRAAEELLEGLLDISQLESGRMQAEIQVFNAQELLDDLYQQYAPSAKRRKLRLSLHMKPVYVRSDMRLLRRILQNFLANALRYTQEGRIILGGRVRGNQVEFQVWDSGQGIPPNHLEKIFDEFQRYEQSFDWGERGLGLGLSICQRISVLLGHTLAVRSEVGKGSMFSVSVPLANEKEKNYQQEHLPHSSAASSLSGMRVLCLDNDLEILQGMQLLLTQWGVEVIAATTIDDALQMMDQKPHVLLVDYHLHDRLDGLDSLDALRNNARHLHGALLTADGSDELRNKARQRGYIVLTKPVKAASLRSFLTAQYESVKPKFDGLK